MSEPIYYELKIDWERDFTLMQAIKHEIQKKWKENCFMAPRIKTNDHYWGEQIDYLADILLQIDNHKNP